MITESFIAGLCPIASLSRASYLQHVAPQACRRRQALIRSSANRSGSSSNSGKCFFRSLVRIPGETQLSGGEFHNVQNTADMPGRDWYTHSQELQEGDAREFGARQYGMEPSRTGRLRRQMAPGKPSVGLKPPRPLNPTFQLLPAGLGVDAPRARILRVQISPSSKGMRLPRPCWARR